jgi:hypothetical protein
MFATDDRAEARVGWDEVSGPPDGAVADLVGREAGTIKATVNVYETGRLDEVLAVVERSGLTAELSSAPIMPGVPVVNITARGVTKGTAVTWLAGRRGLHLAAAVAVGDGWNDVSMFDVAGTAVAMGQAPEGVRDRADVVAPAFDQDGLATVLDLLAGHRPLG